MYEIREPGLSWLSCFLVYSLLVPRAEPGSCRCWQGSLGPRQGAAVMCLRARDGQAAGISFAASAALRSVAQSLRSEQKKAIHAGRGEKSPSKQHLSSGTSAPVPMRLQLFGEVVVTSTAPGDWAWMGWMKTGSCLQQHRVPSAHSPCGSINVFSLV